MSIKHFWQKQKSAPAPSPSRSAPTLRGSKSYSLADAETMGCFEEEALTASDARQARDPEEVGHV